MNHLNRSPAAAAISSTTTRPPTLIVVHEEGHGLSQQVVLSVRVFILHLSWFRSAFIAVEGGVSQHRNPLATMVRPGPLLQAPTAQFPLWLPAQIV